VPIRAFSCLSIALSLAACAAPAPSEDPLSVSVRWGLTGASALPEEVGAIDIDTCTQLDGEEEQCESFSCSVDALTLNLPPDRMQPEGCRTAEGTEIYGDAPVLVRKGLPAGARVRFELVATPGSGDSTALYAGYAGPFVLGEGERRFVELQMYPVGQSVTVPGADVSRFLHTATRLPDGRILVAGGFDQVEQAVVCPEERMLPEGTSCFRLTATRQALAFDPTTGEVDAIRSPMLAARAGHTATALPDGRVLLAGGAPGALMAMIPQGGVAAPSGYRFDIVPLDADGAEGAHASYEIFDAFLNGEEDDPDRDGDLGRGGFLGTAGTTNPGAMNQPRFMHAAAATPNRADRVLIAGGQGGERSAATYEVFDARKPGGYGFYRDGGDLSFPRPFPSAVGFGGTVWIFGGRLAQSNDELAEIWSGGDDPNGSTQPASMAGSFPSGSPTEEQQHPEFSLHRPMVTTIDSGQRALVVGWYGAQCEPGMMAPVFAADGLDTEFCNVPSPPATRSFTVSIERGLTAPTQVRPHAFGAVTEMFEFRGSPTSRRVAVSGGAANANWTGNRAIDVFSGTVDGTGAAMALPGASLTLQSERIFHTTTGIPGWGAITLGGFTFTPPAVDRVNFESGVEAFFLPR